MLRPAPSGHGLVWAYRISAYERCSLARRMLEYRRVLERFMPFYRSNLASMNKTEVLERLE
jgi:hypothetical protein